MDSDNDNFSDEFDDVLISYPQFGQTSSSSHDPGKNSQMVDEISNQLEQSCFEITAWFEQILQTPVNIDILTSLRSGLILCKVAEILYPSNPPTGYVEVDTLSYDTNLKAFGDHCKAIGLDETLIVRPDMFTEQSKPVLITCLFEYINHFTNFESETTVVVDNQISTGENPVNQPLLSEEQPKQKKRGLFSCCLP